MAGTDPLGLDTFDTCRILNWFPDKYGIPNGIAALDSPVWTNVGAGMWFWWDEVYFRNPTTDIDSNVLALGIATSLGVAAFAGWRTCSNNWLR